MSASPAAGPNGTPTPTSGGPPPVVRRTKKTDALRTYRKQPVRPIAKKKDSNLSTQPVTTPKVPPNLFKQIATPGQNGNWPREKGWDGAEPALGTYWDYPLTTTKREMRENLRYHVARFQAKRKVDPTDQDEFIRPVSLHRRDPRQPPPGKVLKDEDVVMEDAIDDKEREKQEIARAAKEAQRAADLAQIAPSGNNASALAQKKHTSFRNEKTTQVFKTDENEEQKKMSDLRYEEGLPWHLEDAENNQTWVGTYEAALSHTNVMFFMDGPNFRMVPLEKWYKFTQKNQFKVLTIEEAEAQMNKKSRASRWAMHTAEQQQEAAERETVRQMTKGLYSKVKGEGAYIKKETGGDGADDLDMDEDDLFQDDDEQQGFEPEVDEDTKFTKEKIKQEQMGANLFGEADENKVEEELKKEEEIAALNKRLGKGTIKSLRKREKNYTYESDSSNPYSSSSDDDTSDEEKIAEEDRRKDEEAKAKAKAAATKQLPSGASSKGTNTPSGRPKHSEPLKKNHLKRSGSPNLSASETSGNESARKKPKKKHLGGPSSQPAGTSTPRGMSPNPPSSAPSGLSPRKSSIVKLPVAPSKLSDIQSLAPNPAMSDGEMSDGARRKKSGIKLRLGGSTTNSRAGSPAVGSRAGSPALSLVQAQTNAPQGLVQAQGNAPSATPVRDTRPITAPEIVAALPVSGISIGQLLKLFSGRLKDGGKDKAEREVFIKLVKENSTYNPEDKLLRPKA